MVKGAETQPKLRGGALRQERRVDVKEGKTRQDKTKKETVTGMISHNDQADDQSHNNNNDSHKATN